MWGKHALEDDMLLVKLWLQASDSWLTSVKPDDNCKRRFTTTLNRVKVFEAAITRTLQHSAASERVNKSVLDTAAHQQCSGVSGDGRVAVMLNCSLVARHCMCHHDVTVTYLRQLIVTQHIHSLLTDQRSVLTQSLSSDHQSVLTDDQWSLSTDQWSVLTDDQWSMSIGWWSVSTDHWSRVSTDHWSVLTQSLSLDLQYRNTTSPQVLPFWIWSL